MSAPRILVVGGIGSFGARLVRGLTSTTKSDVLIGSRTAGTGRVQIDTRTVTAEQLRDLDLFAVADAAGPYQSGDYRLARAAIAAGIHYVDIADARNFVAGFWVLDEEARTANVLALTGASSTPALSNAVLDELVRGWSAIASIEIAIAPGNRAPRGLSVIQSILSYSGKPVRVFVDGGWTERPGWGMTLRREIDGLGKRWLSLCETPDLDVVPARFFPRRSAVFRAGLELPVMHLGLAAGAKAVKWGLVPNLLPFAKALRWIAERLEPFGSDRGGMTVEASGWDEAGKPCRASWTLVAEAGDGPVIPTLPALAALRALADGRLTRRGAMVCAGVLDLETLSAAYRITTSLRRSPP
jgi:saccharopine dehydrogenase-like NADP-dependent oxidoreductase